MKLVLGSVVAILAGVPLDEPGCAIVLEIGNVCCPSRVEILRKAFLKVDGIRDPDTVGDLSRLGLDVLESKSIPPSAVLAVLDRIRSESQGENDFVLLGYSIESISGTVEQYGTETHFIARGSRERYVLVPDDSLQKLIDAGTRNVTLAGAVAEVTLREEKRSFLRLEVREARESK